MSDQNFDDPALKEALRRNFPAESAPQGLRARISFALAKEADADSSAPAMKITASSNNKTSGGTFRLFGTPMRKFALAACLLIAVGITASILMLSPAKLDPNFASAAVRRHDGCCKEPDHHAPNVPQSSFATIGTFMVQELKHPVMVPDLAKDGFAFAGAAICPVKGMKTSHLIYRNAANSSTISVFSLPESAVTEPKVNGQLESTTPDGHMVIVRHTNGAVYCMVGYCPNNNFKMTDLNNMLTAHQNDIVASVPPGQRISLADVHVEE